MSKCALLVVLAARVLLAQADAKIQVLHADSSYRQALLRADIQALDALLADDVLIVHSDGAPDHKKNFLDAISSGRLKFRSYVRSAVEVRIHGATAILFSRTRKVFAYKNTPAEDHDTSLVTYVKQDGRWRIVAMQNTHTPQDDPPPATPPAR
jgi:uncharacterized protein (TIGR02246 family)